MEKIAAEGSGAMAGAGIEEIRKSRRKQALEPEYPYLNSPSRRKNAVGEDVLNNKYENDCEDDESVSMVSGVSRRSKGSNYSTASSRNQVMKKQLKVELNSFKRISEMENTVALEKLAREKEIEKRRVEMEKLIIEEESDEDLQNLDAVDGAEVPEQMNTNNNKNVVQWLDKDAGWGPPASDVKCQLLQTNISDQSRWFTGPKFMREPEKNWPEEPSTQPPEVLEEEVKKRTVCIVTTVTKFELPDPEQCSSWIKIIRITAWVVRFVKNFVKNSKKMSLQRGKLLVNELQQAEQLWWKAVQQEHFPLEMSRLVTGSAIDSSSKLIALCPYLDNDGVMRVQGRAERAEVLGT
ncbi:unnamed protein product, partial [Allacma fusca]